jgi:hypothetical protein
MKYSNLGGLPASLLVVSIALGMTQVGIVITAKSAQPTITTGSPDGARRYYDRISSDLRFQAKPDATTLDDLLQFAGYPTSFVKLETLAPDVLMDPVRASADAALGLRSLGLAGASLRPDDILAARFFAPKIVNVNDTDPTPGWRKLVRLRARPDSAAARVGVESIVVLFNYFSPAAVPPFGGRSVNTQVMLIAPSLTDRLYWLDFDTAGKLTLALNASFDARDLPKGGTNAYFVPDGCNACHGSPGNFHAPMVNYLDTDHWFDRLTDDFVSLRAAGTPVLFDAGTNDSSQPSFHAAFDVIRRFNEEALRQNSLVGPALPEAEAAKTWLAVHADSDQQVPSVRRGFSMNGGLKWQQSEEEGLGRLNRYCFRCHGTIHFSIFDRPTVVEMAGTLIQHINPSLQQRKIDGFLMPPDRTLNPAEVQALEQFLRGLR